MVRFTRILCPIDFSGISMRALAHATTLARWYEAQLDVLHVVPAYDHDVIGPPVPSSPALIVLYFVSMRAREVREVAEELRYARIPRPSSRVRAPR